MINSNNNDSIIDDLLIESKNKYKFRITPIIIWMAFLFVGISFKIMHWPFANVLIVFNSAGLTAWLLTDFYFLKGKNIIVNIFSILSILWILIIIWGMFFNDGYPYNIEGFTVFLMIFIIYSIVYYLIKRYKVNRTLRENK